MDVKKIEYVDGEHTLVGQLVYDATIKTPQPAVILFHAFEGLGKFTLDYAKKIAEAGYIVFAADMYGNGEVAYTLEDCFRLITPFLHDRALVRRRAVLAFNTLSQHAAISTILNKNKISAMGFCFGGMCMLELARSGAPLYAGVSAHGVLAKSALPTHTVKSKLLILHGYRDPQVPSSSLHDFAQEMDAAHAPDWVFTCFGHAKHSYTDPATGTYDAIKEAEMGREYNATAAARTFRYALEFFE